MGWSLGEGGDVTDSVGGVGEASAGGGVPVGCLDGTVGGEEEAEGAEEEAADGGVAVHGWACECCGTPEGGVLGEAGGGGAVALPLLTAATGAEAAVHRCAMGDPGGDLWLARASLSWRAHSSSSFASCLWVNGICETERTQ